MKRITLIGALLAGLGACGTVPLPEGTPACGPDIEPIRPSFSVTYRTPDGNECMYCRHAGVDDEVTGCGLPDGGLCAGQAQFAPGDCWVPQ